MIIINQDDVDFIATAVNLKVDKVNDEYHVVSLKTGNIEYKLATLVDVWDKLYPIYSWSRDRQQYANYSYQGD
jgi:endonuclease I